MTFDSIGSERLISRKTRNVTRFCPGKRLCFLLASSSVTTCRQLTVSRGAFYDLRIDPCVLLLSLYVEYGYIELPGHFPLDIRRRMLLEKA